MNQSFIIKDSRSVDVMFHASTESVITLLNHIEIEGGKAFHALDVGTGSGIIAMVIAKKWQKSMILATDISKSAISDTRENIMENGFGSQIRTIQSVGLDHPEIRKIAPYGLIVANLVAKYHVQYIAEMQKMLEKSGVLILSGILLWRLQEVEQALAHTSLSIVTKVESQGWLTLALARN